MALFPHLDFEKKLQINDKTRLDATKSFKSKDNSDITGITIKPGADESAIDVLGTSSDDWFLDWEFGTWNIDIDSTNNKLDFKEAGGSEVTATLTTNTYTLSALATEIKTQMDSAGSLTYTVSVDDEDKMTISAGSDFDLLPTEGSNATSSILPIVGFEPKPGFGDSDFDNSSSYTGEKIRWLPKAITVELDDGTVQTSETFYLNLYSVEGDALFSSDNDLRRHKSDIMKWVEPGRNSFLNMHRRAQELIIADLREDGYIDINGDPFELKAFVNSEEVRQYSTFLTLRLIMDDLSNAVDDIFHRQAREFEGREMQHKSMAILRIDIDNDGKADVGEGLRIRSGRLIRQ